MKSCVVFCVLIMIGLSLGDTVLYPRGCIYVNGRCYKECEEGTHAYTTGCGLLKKEPSCDEPVPKQNKNDGIICDYSACYCNPPTVRNKETKTCVLLEDCPKNEKS